MKPCPFCKKQHTKLWYKNFLGYQNESVHEVYSEQIPAVSLECREGKYKPIIPLSLWQSRPIEDELQSDIARLQERVQGLESAKTSMIPCCLCGGKVIEFVIPNELWNRVIRIKGREANKEYLCFNCWNNKLTQFINKLDAENKRLAKENEDLTDKLTMSGQLGRWE